MNSIKTFKSFPAAAKEYFGLKPNESLKEFMSEVAVLSPEDRQEMAAGMAKEGVIIQA